MAQRYTDPKAELRMAAGLCPECGTMESEHDGWGGPHGCFLTDVGVAGRIYQYKQDTKPIEDKR